jgi:hypothetical protein
MLMLLVQPFVYGRHLAHRTDGVGAALLAELASVPLCASRAATAAIAPDHALPEQPAKAPAGVDCALCTVSSVNWDREPASPVVLAPAAVIVAACRVEPAQVGRALVATSVGNRGPPGSALL